MYALNKRPKLNVFVNAPLDTCFKFIKFIEVNLLINFLLLNEQYYFNWLFSFSVDQMARSARTGRNKRRVYI